MTGARRAPSFRPAFELYFEQQMLGGPFPDLAYYGITPPRHVQVAYVCGPPAMVEAAMKTLMSRRLFPRDIYREEFLDESSRSAGGLRSPLIRR
ncbi:MAG TPA: hypothetical protein VFP72_03075 [Kineosporiaceae bacterium]|nr:hypothetical protein [Kineosporiaceae bacterium]